PDGKLDSPIGYQSERDDRKKCKTNLIAQLKRMIGKKGKLDSFDSPTERVEYQSEGKKLDSPTEQVDTKYIKVREMIRKLDSPAEQVGYQSKEMKEESRIDVMTFGKDVHQRIYNLDEVSYYKENQENEEASSTENKELSSTENGEKSQVNESNTEANDFDNIITPCAKQKKTCIKECNSITIDFKRHLALERYCKLISNLQLYHVEEVSQHARHFIAMLKWSVVNYEIFIEASWNGKHRSPIISMPRIRLKFVSASFEQHSNNWLKSMATTLQSLKNKEIIHSLILASKKFSSTFALNNSKFLSTWELQHLISRSASQVEFEKDSFEVHKDKVVVIAEAVY
ncbi:1850_t:CDS:2, partial [Scutellospora calospora]